MSLRGILMVAAALTLTACATAQMHTDEQLNAVAQQCGLSLGEIMQDDSEKRLLFVMRPDVSAPQRHCTYQWARRNHLRLVVIHLATETQN
jgi:hypothetical protein